MTISSKRKSVRQETRLAEDYDGKVTPGSGNGWRHKNDVKADDLSIEAKYTDKRQFTLKQADLHTAERNALLDGGRDSVFIISFGGEQWAVIREEEYRDLRGRKVYPYKDGEALILGPECFMGEGNIAYKGAWYSEIPTSTAVDALVEDREPTDWEKAMYPPGMRERWVQPMLPGAAGW